jgi:hypothetical protein
MGRELIDALGKLLKLYDGAYARGIDIAIAEACDDATGWKIRQLFREEDARYGKCWPEMLGSPAWQVELSAGRLAVILRLRRLKKRLSNEQRKQEKAGRTSGSDGEAGGGAAAVL